ncbi:hypothetical protein CBP36_21505 (plasmid) [Acidovorax carolinensis]|uniref:Large polyvalent protein-associated domain-containing protein n=2 Tax=Acidovorax carolinensis TaxID=553814 RepID=A0A240UKH3_9BURK|nr:hypothetical protein CBP36_21505 [Acidovorax carolinensis]
MRVTDDEIKLALVHSREKFGRQITLTGDDPVFVERMARLAEDMGLSVLNPELKPVIEAHREAKKQAAGQVAKEAAQAAFKPRAQEDTGHMSAGAEKAAETAQEAQKGAGQGEGVQETLAAVTPDLRPIEEPALPTAGDERLRALVLAIDPRAKFQEADPADEKRLYVGPVASSFRRGTSRCLLSIWGRGQLCDPPPGCACGGWEAGIGGPVSCGGKPLRPICKLVKGRGGKGLMINVRMLLCHSC